MTRIYIVRHAEAEGNLYRRIHGQYDSLVTPMGYQQIAALAERFRDIPVDAVYSSDLYRTRMTAKAIYEPKGLPLHLEPGLREIHMGRWEDQTWGGGARQDSERMDQFSRGDLNYDSPGGESFPEVQKRVLETYDRLARAHEGQTIVCVSHGVAIRTAMTAFYGHPLSELNRILPSDNTGVSCVDFEDGRAQVRFYADGSHLSEELSTLGKQTWWREQEASTPLEDQNVWYRPWDPVGERALYGQYRREAWIGIHGPELPFPGEKFYEAARAASLRNPAAVMVAMVGDEIAGLLQMDLERYAEEQAGYIPFYYMNPAFRKHGLGVQLIGQAVSTFRPMGRDRLRLRCSPDNEVAQRFYARNEFRRIGPAPDSDVPLDLLEKYIGYAE